MFRRSISLVSFICVLYDTIASAQDGASYPSGFPDRIGNGWCDMENNNQDSNYDGDDCCACGDESPLETFIVKHFLVCRDPNSECDLDPRGSKYTNCSGAMNDLEDGYCDQRNNIDDCGYDGGDCSSYLPSCAGGYTEGLGDEFCDLVNNIEECNFDGGDCDNDLVDSESEPNLVNCSTEVQLERTVNSTATANELAEAVAVSCPGGSFTVTWKGNVFVKKTISIFGGTVLSVAGFGSDAVINGDGKTGLFEVVNATLHLENVTLLNGRAYEGGGIAASGSSISVSGASFESNNASMGGALHMSSGTNVSFDRATTFARNNASNHGGALYMSSSSSAIWNGASYFDSNSAKGSGGAIYLSDGSSVYWNAESRFVNNTAQTNGGVMFLVLYSRVVWMAASSFEQNSALEFDGGALYVKAGSTAVWSGTSYFFANDALSDGGAVYATRNGSLTWNKDVMFANNTAKDGGAVFITNGATAEWNGASWFYFNYAGLDGGAVGSRAFDSELTTSDGEFDLENDIESLITFRGIAIFMKNTCGANGGGVALVQSLSISFQSENVTFSQNSADIAGGGVFVAGKGIGVHFINVTFWNNSAQTGGGLYATGSGTAVTVDGKDEQVENPTVFNHCTFVDNFAFATGGGVDSSSGQDVFKNSTFERNIARVGGALRLAGTATIERCNFTENLSDLGCGPAVSNVGYMNNLTDCSFIDNAFYCEPEHYLDYNDTRNFFETICNGCDGNCYYCDLGENTEQIPTCRSLAQEKIEHASSKGGTTRIDEIIIDEGFWRAENTSKNVYECFNVKACQGGVTGRTGYCDEGYEGPYCSVCSTNHVPSLSYTCRKCAGRDLSIPVSIGLGILLFAALLAIFSYLVSADVGGTGRGLVDRVTRWIPTQSVKIIIVAWQILTQFASVANVTFPSVYQKFLDGIDVLNFELSWVVSAGCFLEVDFHDRLLWTTVGPAVIMCLLGMTYAIAIQRNRGLPEIALRNARDKHLSMALLVTFLVYSSASSVVFQMFACDTLDDGNRYLRADYTILCDSPKHRFFEVYASFMIAIYPVGIPVLYTGLLLKDRRLLQDQKGRVDSLVVRPTSGLWQPYRPNRFYYEVIECARRILLAGVVVFIYPNTAAQIAVTLAIAVVFVFVSEGMTPYESPWDTWISRIGHAVIFASMYLALLLKVDVSSDNNNSQRLFETILVASHGSMVLAVVIEIIATVFSVKTEEEQENQAQKPSPNNTPSIMSKSNSTWKIGTACVEDDEDCNEA